MSEKLIAIFSKLANVDQLSTKFLAEALSKNNLPGFDYLEFKQSLDALESLNMGEITAFQSAFATASTMGLTKAKLLETASFYQKILEKEQSQFEKALQQQTKIQIAGKQKEMEQVQALILQKMEQIKRLEQEIDQHKVQIENAVKQIEVSKEKIFAAKENFEQTYEVIAAEIDSDIQKMKTYLS